MSRGLLADGVCSRGHRIDGYADVTVDVGGVHRCAACVREMNRERANIRLAARDRADREAAQRRRDLYRASPR